MYVLKRVILLKIHVIFIVYTGYTFNTNFKKILADKIGYKAYTAVF